MEDKLLHNLDVFSSMHEPYWIASTPKTEHPGLDRDITVDVVVIGGGIVGISTAFLLKREGLKVAVIEADRILQGTTGHTTAKVTSQHGLIYYKIKDSMGEEKARQYAEANETAIRFIADLVKNDNIDCDFSPQSAYVYTQDENYIEKIQREAEVAAAMGIKADYLDKIPLPFDIKAAVRFEDQAQFHPRKYLLHLSKEIPGDGSYIFEKTRVIDIEKEDRCTVITDRGKKVTANKVVVATHFPCYDGGGMYFARMYQKKSYALGVKVKDKYPGGMYITAEEPGRSVRSQSFDNGEMLIIGGEHHKTGSEKKTNVHYENLANFARDNFQLEGILFRWSTQDCMTADDVPYIGRLTSKNDNLFVATGFGKWGMTNSTVAAIMIRDLITKGESPWQDVYNPSRFNAKSAGHIAMQNLDVAYTFVGGKAAPAPDLDEIEINTCEAKVIEIDGDKYGAYKDEEGKLHIVDITCTHLGCELVWNEAERTWDCPCHGSRFSIDGDNIDSPAFIKLKGYGEGKNEKDPNLF